MDSAQIKRIAEQCGIQLNTKSPIENDYLATLSELERFARAIRNQTLEEAADKCMEWRAALDNRSMQLEGWSAAECASAIRAMKGE